MDRHYLMRSTGDQETDCRSWCGQQGWKVGKVITDANRSASQWRTREREGFEEALQLIASKRYAAFVTWEPSRAGRELAAYIQLRAACQAAGVLYLTKGRVYDFARSDDAFMMGLGVPDRREGRRRDPRAPAPHGAPATRSRAGLTVGSPSATAASTTSSTGVLLRQEIDPEKASIITNAVDEILRGVPVNRIVTRLNREGVPTPMKPTSDHSRGWMNATLTQVIRSPTIAGLRKYQGEVIGEADWPAIIPVDRWEKVNRVLGDRARRTRYVEEDNHSRPRWLLSHVAKCAFCSRPLVRVHNVIPRKNGKPRNNYICPWAPCRRISIDVERTDAYVVGALLGWLSTPESLAVLAGPTRVGTSESARPRSGWTLCGADSMRLPSSMPRARSASPCCRTSNRG
jgi:DNA invertase Pin-like site-specific DNA recombinase